VAGPRRLPTSTRVCSSRVRRSSLSLDAALHRVDEDGAGAMFVIGEAGSGKTELLAEFARRAQDDDRGSARAVGAR
jgi:stage III sporulation protein SpoIIIAA